MVGYDTLGHCFFTEDGPEERNTFDRCLGLMVRAGTLLPSDRDRKMCRDITNDSYPGYVANPRQDCRSGPGSHILYINKHTLMAEGMGTECFICGIEPFLCVELSLCLIKDRDIV